MEETIVCNRFCSELCLVLEGGGRGTALIAYKWSRHKTARQGAVIQKETSSGLGSPGKSNPSDLCFGGHREGTGSEQGIPLSCTWFCTGSALAFFLFGQGC